MYANNFYGTLRTEVERIWAKGNHVIFDVDVDGGLNLKHAFKDRMQGKIYFFVKVKTQPKLGI